VSAALEAQLRWFHAAITAGPPPDDEAGAMIEAHGVASPAARLHVYAHAYVARLAGVLVAEYPKLVVIHPALATLTADYLRAFPPSRPSVREVGAHLACFLASRGEPAHLVELAALERARTEAFDGGADVTPRDRAARAELPPDAFPTLPLRFVPSHRLVALTTTADELWDAVESGAPHLAPGAATRAVLVWRRGVTVVHRTLDDDEAALAPALAAGTTFGDVCEALAADPAPAERALTLLLRWLDAAALEAS
jgi:hypothetical protein